jgi:hypothetical protein
MKLQKAVEKAKQNRERAEALALEEQLSRKQQHDAFEALGSHPNRSGWGTYAKAGS